MIRYVRPPITPDDILAAAGRLPLALLFLGGCVQKFTDPLPVQTMLASVGLPDWAIWPVALFNLAGGIGLILGWRQRPLCLILAVYCLVTSWFHWDLRADPWQVTIMVKNWAIAGGLTILATRGAGRLSVDGWVK